MNHTLRVTPSGRALESLELYQAGLLRSPEFAELLTAGLSISMSS
jgi:hypothetical protein